MPCESCPRRAACRVICPALEAKLPKLHDNVTHGHTWGEEDRRRLARKRRLARMAIDRRMRLQGREREVLDMVFNKSMTVRRTAIALGASRTWVRKLLRSAFARMRRANRRRRRKLRRERAGKG